MPLFSYVPIKTALNLLAGNTDNLEIKDDLLILSESSM